MRARLAAALVIGVLAVTTTGGCSVSGSEGSEQTATLRDMQQRSEQIGNDLLAQLDGQLAPDHVDPDSRIESDDPSDAAPLDHGRRYWYWNTRVNLADDATIDAQQGVDELAAHLASEGWTVTTPTALDPVDTNIRVEDDYGSWLVQVAPVSDHVDITVISPVTTRD
jgi:hypothetical protein